MDWDHQITSDFSELQEWDPEGDKVEVGFRPSGELHVGNLLTIGYAAAAADWIREDLMVTVCDTDWSAHLHQHHFPDNNRVMKLFFQRDCPCGDHETLSDHRLDEIQPYLDALEKYLGINIRTRKLTELHGDKEYTDALRNVLKNMNDFDDIFGGGFRRRYISPVTVVCDECGYSHAKGASYSPGTDELVAPCRNTECTNGFASDPLTGRIGVYYLVDPVRDISEDVAVHVFGGDYRTAEKEQVTPKISKVAKITELANNAAPASSYFLAPMIADSEGKPLSKSKGTGRTVSDIEDLSEFGRKVSSEVTVWIEEEKKHIQEDELY
jgi:lysyl-tRNA synthetase class I